MASFRKMHPNDMRFNRVGYNDVGVHCGGWGNLIQQCTESNIEIILDFRRREAPLEIKQAV
jgi:hypothetical protein